MNLCFYHSARLDFAEVNFLEEEQTRGLQFAVGVICINKSGCRIVEVREEKRDIRVKPGLPEFCL